MTPGHSTIPHSIESGHPSMYVYRGAGLYAFYTTEGRSNLGIVDYCTYDRSRVFRCMALRAVVVPCAAQFVVQCCRVVVSERLC